MSREIKFRTYLEGIEFKFFKIGEDVIISTKNGANQFTGLLDKAGVEIYEGDILTGVTADSEYAIISFEGARFIARAENGDYIHHYLSGLCNHSIIVGNIYENPELLKGE